MPKIRVLVVDDSVVIRRLLTDCLTGDPDIEVAGTAASGRIALQKITQINPDVVTLDVEMPEMDGIQTLIEIRRAHPRLPVIMFSTLTERGASSTLDALSHGASDYVTKPANVGSVSTALQRVRDEMIPKVKALCVRRAPDAAPLRRPVAPPVAPARSPAAASAPGTAPVELLVIGVSTGGPNALAKILPELPASFPVPVVIVQHMPPMFTKLLAERLSGSTQIPVREAAGGELLEPGTIWIAPGDHHVAIVRKAGVAQLALNQDPPENSCRPAVDVLFRSAAEVYGEHVLAVVLTGMGQDGLLGATWIKERQGRVLVQDEATSVVWGMPGFVARAGLADQVLPLERIARTLVSLAATRDEPLRASSVGGAR
jgi:two-component system, chemotaxis family, protein-glutamate methylesterase/glutaminase